VQLLVDTVTVRLQILVFPDMSHLDSKAEAAKAFAKEVVGAQLPAANHLLAYKCVVLDNTAQADVGSFLVGPSINNTAFKQVSHQVVNALSQPQAGRDSFVPIVFAFDGQFHSCTHGEQRPTCMEDLQRRAAEAAAKVFGQMSATAGAGAGKSASLTQLLRSYMDRHWLPYPVASCSSLCHSAPQVPPAVAGGLPSDGPPPGLLEKDVCQLLLQLPQEAPLTQLGTAIQSIFSSSTSSTDGQSEGVAKLMEYSQRLCESTGQRLDQHGLTQGIYEQVSVAGALLLGGEEQDVHDIEGYLQAHGASVILPCAQSYATKMQSGTAVNLGPAPVEAEAYMAAGHSPPAAQQSQDDSPA
jgi:hypothetical protein